jgi:hypothetical protein
MNRWPPRESAGATAHFYVRRVRTNGSRQCRPKSGTRTMAPELITRLLRRRNLAAVLKMLLHDGETSRGQLAPAACACRPSPVAVVTDLMTEGLVCETGSLPSDGGRPVTRPPIRPDGLHFIRADVGENGVTVEVFDLTLAPRSKAFRDARSRVVGTRRNFRPRSRSAA